MKRCLGLFLSISLVALSFPRPGRAGGEIVGRGISRLHILAIGINEYKDPKNRLQSAKADAQDFADAMERAGKFAFIKISKQVLLDGQATRDAVEAAFNKIASEAKPDDVFVFHFAGYGGEFEDKESSAKDFYLPTHEVENVYDVRELKKGISAAQLSAWCAKIPARNQLIVLDACRSDTAFEKIAGRVVGENKEITELSGRNIMILGAGGYTFDSFNYQGETIKHSVITYALLQALSGEDALGEGDRDLTAKDVEAFFNYKVRKLTGRMTPKSYSTGDDFRLAFFPKSPQEAKAQQEKLRNATLATAASKPQETKLEPGTNYAIFFATDKYDDSTFDTLNNPLSDANAIAESLQKFYGFETRVIPNPSLKEIAGVIREYQKKTYKPSDHLFIFFAGHGTFDEVSKSGYIVARDSKADDETRITYFPYSHLKDAVDNIPCEHIFLTLDVCFGGTFIQEVAQNSGGKYRTVPETAKLTVEELIRRKVDKKTRKLLTSGATEVFDGKPGEHSPFAMYFLDVLETYGGKDGYLTFEDIYKSVERTKPGPIGDNFGRWEAGSNFFFVASENKPGLSPSRTTP